LFVENLRRKRGRMAIDVELGGKAKVVLDFWKSNKGREYLTARRFYLGKDGRWYPQKSNGMFLQPEEWEAMIPKLKEMIYYKNAPAGSPPFDEDEGKMAEGPSGETAPSDDDF
jgi:hypothetical protein